jgi:hypothetical protein
MVDDQSPKDPTIQRRLREVEDRLALLDLEATYARAYDSQQGERWAELFTVDGVYQGRQLEGMPPQNLIRGRENLARFCADQPASGMHSMHAPQLELDGDRATGRVHFQFQSMGVDDHRRTHFREVTGSYDIAYVRTEEGWRIQRRVTNYLEIVQRTTFAYQAAPAAVWEPLADVPDDAQYQDRRS